MEPSKSFSLAQRIARTLTSDELRELDGVLKDPTEQAFLVYHLQAEVAPAFRLHEAPAPRRRSADDAIGLDGPPHREPKPSRTTGSNEGR